MRTLAVLVVTVCLVGVVGVLTLSALPVPATATGPAGALTRTAQATRDMTLTAIGLRHRPVAGGTVHRIRP